MADSDLEGRLEAYLMLIEREREGRPSEAMLVDEIVRLRTNRSLPGDHRADGCTCHPVSLTRRAGDHWEDCPMAARYDGEAVGPHEHVYRCQDCGEIGRAPALPTAPMVGGSIEP